MGTGTRTLSVVAAAAVVLGAAVALPASPARAAVPAPGPTSAVVTVKVGGDRVDDTTIAGLAGVELGLFANQADTTPLLTCTSDADGDCSFVVTGAVLGTAPWVKETAAPAGWFANDVLRTGPGSGSGSVASPYEFQTPTLVEGNTYRSTSEFMKSSSNSLPTRSNGVWQQSRINPPLPASCGMDVALVLDLSASVGSNLPTLKSAADSFADAFVGTPSRMGVYSFSAESPSTQAGTGAVDANRPALQSVSTQAGADAFKAEYAGWGLGAGTNWDAALQRVADSGIHYDAVVVLTDGNPTRWGGTTLHGDGSSTHFTDTEAAIFSANVLKAEGTRVISFGIGSGVSGITSLNLAAISGQEAFDAAAGNVATADYFQIPDFSGAGDELRRLALANCTPSLTVIKQIVPGTTTGEDIAGAAPAGAGWTFDAAALTPGATVTPATATTQADGTGGVAFRAELPTGGAEALLSVAETQQPGYSLVTQGGVNAVCTDLAGGTPVAVTNDGALGFQVVVGADQAVGCMVYNRKLDPATVEVDKSWVVDGVTYANGSQPSGISAALQLSPPGGGSPVDQTFGSVVSGYAIGDAISFTETTSLARAGCTLESARVTEANGTTVDAALPYAATLTVAASHYTVTNVVHCTTAPVTPPGGSTGSEGSEPEGGPMTGTLSDTGSETGWMLVPVLAAVLLIGAGIALRRRKSNSTSAR
ncbi:vWA domain-containing protein [Leifsonia sp. NPDC080035]|uniref:VWA domain-containing protein n=1 Tax=Leifsonia sp. NPDC080035 TaxID=3143936 RepID=A0AAU7GFH9_9MICO